MRTAFFISVFCLLFSSVFAQSTRSSVFSHLTRSEGAAMQLELDLQELLAKRKTNDYIPATVTDAAGNTFKAEVRARGKFRRKTCDIPPLKIKFSKKGLAAQGLDTLNEVKLTIPCMDDPEGEELILREYAAYRLYEHLSEYHVKAGLVRLRIKDTHTGKFNQTVYCLVTEHEEETLARLGGKMVETYSLSAKQVDEAQNALHSVFQYMIGNTDWELATFRNVHQFKSAADGIIRPIPYDFDFSGFVNAPYATPTVGTGVADVQDRVLMADGISPKALRAAVLKVKNAKSALLSRCKVPLINNSTTVELQHYLNAFFEAAEESLDLPAKMEYVR